MFERLRDNTQPPEVIVSSDAVRAATTAQILRDTIAIDADRLATQNALYHAGVDQILATARALPDTINIAALVGHNPGMTYAANSFTENLELDNLPTCGIVGIEFTVSTWREIDTGSLHYFDYPKNADGPLLGSQA